MLSSDVQSVPDAATLLDELHARYDGRPPRRQRLAALASGNDVLEVAMERAGCERLAVQAAATRLAVARRRRQLPAARAMNDPWLFRLTCALRDARDGMAGPRGAWCA